MLIRRLAIALVLALLVVLPATAQAGASADRALIEIVKEQRFLAEKGDAESQFRLGVHYNLGWGVPQDFLKAAEWYGKAAEQGFLKAMSGLGELYVEGKGIPRNFVLAYMWFSLVVEHPQFSSFGLKESDLSHTTLKRHLLVRHMTPAQIAEAKKLARQWWANHPKKK